MGGSGLQTRQISGESGSESGRGSRLAVAIRDIGKAAVEAHDLIAFCPSDDDLGDALCELETVANQVAALRSELARSASAAGVQFRSGQRTVCQFVASRTNSDPAPVRRAVTVGRWLRDFDTFAAAFATGDLSEAHLQYLRVKLDGPRSHSRLVADQQFFVDTAMSCSFADFRTAGDYWLIHADPDGDEPKDQRDSVRATIRKGRGGRVTVEAEFDAITGAGLRAAVDAEMNKLFDADTQASIVRTITQRRAAAIANLIERGAARADGTHPKPLINIVMSMTVAEWALNWARGESESVPVAFRDRDRRCELIDGTPIHPLAALRHFGVAAFRRHILDAGNRIIESSVNARTFPLWMRNALLIQARGRCTTPGCDAPHGWLHADHKQPHSRNGPTRLYNGQALCGPCNRHKSDRVWPDHNAPQRE